MVKTRARTRTRVLIVVGTVDVVVVVCLLLSIVVCVISLFDSLCLQSTVYECNDELKVSVVVCK